MDEATITIEFSDGTIGYIVVTDDDAEAVAVAIENLLGIQMNLKT